jgi:hypothetical protein
MGRELEEIKREVDQRLIDCVMSYQGLTIRDEEVTPQVIKIARMIRKSGLLNMLTTGQGRASDTTGAFSMDPPAGSSLNNLGNGSQNS